MYTEMYQTDTIILSRIIHVSSFVWLLSAPTSGGPDRTRSQDSPIPPRRDFSADIGAPCSGSGEQSVPLLTAYSNRDRWGRVLFNWKGLFFKETPEVTVILVSGQGYRVFWHFNVNFPARSSLVLVLILVLLEKQPHPFRSHIKLTLVARFKWI